MEEDESTLLVYLLISQWTEEHKLLRNRLESAPEQDTDMLE